jgi:hypothetical protein
VNEVELAGRTDALDRACERDVRCRRVVEADDDARLRWAKPLGRSSPDEMIGSWLGVGVLGLGGVSGS